MTAMKSLNSSKNQLTVSNHSISMTFDSIKSPQKNNFKELERTSINRVKLKEYNHDGNNGATKKQDFGTHKLDIITEFGLPYDLVEKETLGDDTFLKNNNNVIDDD